METRQDFAMRISLTGTDLVNFVDPNSLVGGTWIAALNTKVNVPTLQGALTYLETYLLQPMLNPAPGDNLAGHEEHVNRYNVEFGVTSNNCIAYVKVLEALHAAAQGEEGRAYLEAQETSDGVVQLTLEVVRTDVHFA